MNRIRDLRESKGWTQLQLGKRIGAAKSTVSEYESEKHQLDPVLINKLCDLFGCTSDYLLGRSNTPMPMITDQEAEFLAAYRAAPENVRTAIDALLQPSKQEKARTGS